MTLVMVADTEDDCFLICISRSANLLVPAGPWNCLLREALLLHSLELLLTRVSDEPLDSTQHALRNLLRCIQSCDSTALLPAP